MPEPRARASNSRQLYDHIADTLREAIAVGDLKPGDRLASITELAAQHDAAKGTVQRAVDTLREEGLVETWHGRGVYVRDNAQDAARESPSLATLAALVKQLHQRLDAQDDRFARIEAALDLRQNPPPVAPEHHPAGD